MHTYVLFIFLSLLLNITSGMAQSHLTSDFVGPKAQWQKTSHNFGTIAQGKPVTVNFSFKNVGASPLLIAEVKTTCGCTTPFYTREPVGPGKTGVVNARFNAASTGAFQKTITVYSNMQKPIKLVIKGIVKVMEE